MSIGILLYSYTGNTLSIAEKIKKQLGGDIPIERVTVINGDPNGGQPLKLKNMPNLEQYDKLIIGAPVNAFNLCKAMKMYLQTNPKINAEVNIFVTMHFKRPFLGGNKAVRQIADYCKSQGAEVKNTAIVHWSAKDRDAQIENAVKIMKDI